MREVCIIGLGYIGLPTAAMFATHGVKVTGIDIKKEICELINEGKIHIEEPYLADLVKQAAINKTIFCQSALEPAESFIIAVPTPITCDKKADMFSVISAGEAIAKVLKNGDLVILESTVSPGCTADILKPVLEKSGLRAGKDFYLAHCPERVLPGRILYELEHNNRIIGGIDPESAQKAKDLYSIFVKGEFFLTDTITAELCKLMENTYRDVNIALANELAKICEKLCCNAWDVIKYANKHPRVNIHNPGPGVGGHCLAVDPWFIVESAPELAVIIKSARNTNDGMPGHIYEKVKSMVNINDRIVILGCTYKADVDDIRESPILHLAHLLEENYSVNIVDPYISRFSSNVYEACNNADLIILGVNHKQFRQLNFEVISKIVNQRKLIDTRNFFDQNELAGIGFEVYCIGRPATGGKNHALNLQHNF